LFFFLLISYIYIYIYTLYIYIEKPVSDQSYRVLDRYGRKILVYIDKNLEDCATIPIKML
jgi:hypothetical protein